MRSPKAIVAGVLAVSLAAGILVACSDSSVSPVDRKRPMSTDTAAATSRPQVVAELHRRNRMDWVGQAHSRGIDHFRSALRSRRIKPNELCKALPALLAEDEARILGHRSLSRAQAVAAAREGLANGTCAPRRTASLWFAPLPVASPVVPSAQAASVVLAPLMPSVTVDEALEQIASATATANSSTELAVALNQITGAATSLEPAGQDAVLGAASLALSSTEYWETNFESFSNEVLSEQPCINAQTCEAAYSVARAPMLVPSPQDKIRQIAAADLAAGSWIIWRVWTLGPMAWEGAGLTAAAASIAKAVGASLEGVI